MGFTWQTDARGNKYRVAARDRGYFHVYKNGTVKKLGGPRPKGYSQFDEKSRQYFKTADNGVTAQRIFQNGRKVNTGAGSIFRADPSLLPFYKQGMASSELKYGIPQQTLKTQMERERGAQNQAFGQIASYYAGLSGNAKDLMGQAGQVGQQTDASLQNIGAQRNQAVQAATPQYSGPLGQIAQNLANTEQQAAMNRGAAEDSSSRGLNATTSGNRQAFLGQMGAAQQMAGQERLATLKGQGNQTLNTYGDKIAELERQKSLGAVDSANQLRTAQQSYGIQQQNANANTARAQAAQINATNSGSSGGSGGGSGGGSRRSGGSVSPAANRDFWKAVDKAKNATVTVNGKTRKPTMNELVGQFGTDVAITVRSIWASGGLTPYAVRNLHARGYSNGGRYRVKSHKVNVPVIGDVWY